MSDANPGEETTLQPFEPDDEEIYPIETVVHLTRTPRHQIAVYCRHGLIAPVSKPDREGWWFDHEAIRELRRIECIRAGYGFDIEGLRVIATLLREVERLREEVRELGRR